MTCELYDWYIVTTIILHIHEIALIWLRVFEKIINKSIPSGSTWRSDHRE